MALPSKYGVDKKINSMEGLSAYENGGEGSGNFGHGGRPGKVGGSSKGGSGGNIKVHEGSKEMDYFYAEDGDRILASGKTKEEALAKAKEAVKKMGEELRKKSPVRKQDEWFVTVSEIRDDYEKRSKEIEENADEVGEAISETGESYIGPKQKVVDFLASAIKIHADTYKDASDFLEQAEDLIDDYKYAKTAKSRKLEVSENPMSGSGLVVDEYWDD